MSLLTDKDIRRAKMRDIFVQPWWEEQVTPVGYNFRMSGFVYSTTRRKIIPPVEDGSGKYYLVEPGEMVLLLTVESIWVSGRIGGTLHSKVSLVSKGLSHVSTTLDPNWCGPLLIAMTNVGNVQLRLDEDSEIVTVVFYRVRTPTSLKWSNVGGHADIIQEIGNNHRDDGNSIEHERIMRRYHRIIQETDVFEKLKEDIISRRLNLLRIVALRAHSFRGIVDRPVIQSILFFIILLFAFLAAAAAIVIAMTKTPIPWEQVLTAIGVLAALLGYLIKQR